MSSNMLSIVPRAKGLENRIKFRLEKERGGAPSGRRTPASQLEEVPMDQSWDHLSTKLSKNNNELLFTEKHSNP